MVFGFNHNFRYKGGVYHVQTEDGGEKNPQVITLLYHGGTILSSKKTSYAELVHADNLEKRVEELMKNQHRDMLRRLKEGEFDPQIEASRSEAVPPPLSSPTPPATIAVAAPPAVAAPVVAPPVAPTGTPPTASPAVVPPVKPAAVEPSLDDIILSYLMGGDK